MIYVFYYCSIALFEDILTIIKKYISIFILISFTTIVSNYYLFFVLKYFSTVAFYSSIFNTILRIKFHGYRSIFAINRTNRLICVSVAIDSDGATLESR